MNKFFKYISISAGFLSILGIAGCYKSLDEKVYSVITPVNFYKTEADAKAAINGVYSELYTYDMYVQPFWNLTLLDDDHVSGSDWYLGAAGAGNPQNYWGVSRPWIGCYTLIARANTVLENVSTMTGINEVVKNRILGEAYFLRGWAYLQLVQLYGEVPLRLKSLTADPNADVPRSPVKDVYALIINDFKAAEANLVPPGDPSAGETGRVNKAVAQAFLAKAYLTMASGSASNVTLMVKGGDNNIAYPHQNTVVAGYEPFDSQQYFQLARDKSLEVINSYKAVYPLIGWTELWKKDNRNNGDHMWMLQSLEGTAFTNDLHSFFSARSQFGVGAVWMTNNHYNNYEDQDTRILHGVTHNYQAGWGIDYFYPKKDAAKYEVVNGKTHINDGNGDEKAYVTKYSDVSNPQLGVSDAFFPLLRFAEVLLMYAEAENELSTLPGIEAYKKLNEVRRRANASDAPVGMSKNGFRDYVLEERAREFALENSVRHFDLKRWGIYLSVMNKITQPQNNINKQRSRRNLLLPIPPEEINTNKAITSNNPDW